MDAQAHLLSLGWAGPGHSLDSYKLIGNKGRRGVAYDPTSTSSNHNQIQATSFSSSSKQNGLVKPLLVSQKKNNFGVGKRAHEPAKGSEWWLKGFETALGNIGKTEKEREDEKEKTGSSGTATPNFLNNGYKGKYEDLYGYFVRGREMSGTIGEKKVVEDKAIKLGQKKTKKNKKRKSDTFNEGEEETSETSDANNPVGPGSYEHVSRKKKQRSKDAAVEFAQVGEFLGVRDKEDERHRRRRKDKVGVLEEFQQVGEFLEARSAAELEKKKRRKQRGGQLEIQASSSPVSKPEDFFDQGAVPEESSEEDRRQRRKEETRAAAAAKQTREDLPDSGGDQENVRTMLVPNTTEAGRPPTSPDIEVADGAAAKAARKAERRQRKELERKQQQ